ncbi:hypothetical protein TWF718_002249 [Orbilia javanica]|uniref:Uncharacterized protein n=1 Tax=Orbilia javanica TaxID=47235 RepID=A0AAN8MM68_9PEZI
MSSRSSSRDSTCEITTISREQTRLFSTALPNNAASTQTRMLFADALYQSNFFADLLSSDMAH